MNSTNCQNCGAPHEPYKCSYCLTPSTPPPVVRGSGARFSQQGWADPRALFLLNLSQQELCDSEVLRQKMLAR